ncbi:MAG: GntR family transcriptional regulator [Spirochaetia bacterium]|nr:GntR family transcriptional regulator [Spirochaetia bacterium]
MGKYSVSRNVVRHALKNLEQKGYSRSVKGVGTFVKEVSSISSSSHIVGLITFFSHSYIFPDIIEAIDKELHPKNFHLLIGYSHHSKQREKALLDQFIQKGVSGIILEAVGDDDITTSNYETLKEIKKRGIPLILIDNHIKEIDVTQIILNDYESGRLCAKYFIEKGHTNFAFFYQKDYYPKTERIRGAKEYIEQHAPTATIKNYPFTGQGKLSNAKESACKMIEEYEGEYVALFCSSDEDALYVIEDINKKGLIIGEDISIVGFDNLTSLAITTFNHPSDYMGKIAAREMLDLMKKRSEKESIIITLGATFIERDSVKDLI